MGKHIVAIVGLLGVAGAGCTGEIRGEAEELSVQIEQRSADHVVGTAQLGELGVRFESVSEGTTAGHIIFDLDHGSVAYGVSLDDNEYWSDGQGIALREGDVVLMQQLAAALTEAMADDADDLGFAEMLLVNGVTYLSQAPVGWQIPSRSRALPQPGVSPTDTLWSTADDGIKCVKKYSWYSASWDWPDYYESKVVQVNEGGHCLGKCGDCGFGFGQSWTLDCLEHDSCIKDAASMGLPVVGEVPWDYYCGDEWQEAENDFLYGWMWPFKCNG
jgi:hypothetical protein